jgi:CHAD domain-containing protein
MVRRQDSPPLVGAVAANEIKQRLAVVARQLRRAAKASHHEPEPIHQLRVACRRGRATLEFFATALPQRKAEWFLRKLRKLRKAADEARNLDVYRQRLEQQKVKPSAEVASLLEKRRVAAQKPLRKLDKQLRVSKRWQRKQRQLLKKVRSSRKRAAVLEQTFAAFVPVALSPVLGEFAAALESPGQSAKRLHALRVAGKHLRYALELLEPALPKRLRTSLLAQLKRLQDVLGEINDAATAEGLLAELAQAADGEALRWLQEQRKQEHAAFNAGRARFWRSWTQKERLKWQAALKQCAPPASSLATRASATTDTRRKR